jgi:hypothetical protein
MPIVSDRKEQAMEEKEQAMEETVRTTETAPEPADGAQPDERLADAVAGAVGGLAGAMVMTGAMMLGKRAGMVQEPVPLKVERELEQRAGIDERTTATQEKALAQAEHFAIGASYGALYGMVDGELELESVPFGPLYGLGVYALNFGGFGPAFGLTPPPAAEAPPKLARELMMHAVFGAVTSGVSKRVRQALR